MTIANPTSLTATLDKTAEAIFYQQPIRIPLREEIATLIASRQCQSGVNTGFFIPFTAEISAQTMLFSGEKLSTAFARKHICLIESARMLKLLGVENHGSAQSIQAADDRMAKTCYSNFCSSGECRALTIACLRYLALNDSEEASHKTNDFITRLGTFRDGKGSWGGFTFYYTLLMLTEVGSLQSIRELQYAANRCKKLQSGKWEADSISKRRQVILANALARS